jgi:hypothetical protein
MNIHHWVIPSRKNKFHPHLLRPLGLGLFLLIFLAIPPLYNVVSAGQMQVLGYATSISVTSLYNLTNQQRENNGLPALTLNGQLNSAALAKANHMFANDYWAHVAPDGTTPWMFINNAGYSYTTAGENLAKNFNTSSGVINGWMGSATHKANILSSGYKDVGFAAVNGVLLGEETTLVVAMYGAKAASAPAAAAPVASTPKKTAAPVVTKTVEEPVEKPVAKKETTSTPEKEATPQPTPAETESEVSTAPQIIDTSNETGAVEGLSTFLPVKVYNGLNWGQKASIVLLSLLALLFIMKHTLVWREQKRGFRHIWFRAHPLSQFAMLIAVGLITILSSFGVVL